MNQYQGITDIHNKVWQLLSSGTACRELDDFFARTQTEIDNFKEIGSFNAIKEERITNVLSSDDFKENVNNSVKHQSQPLCRMTRNTALMDIQNIVNDDNSQTGKTEKHSESNPPIHELTEMPPSRGLTPKGTVKKSKKISENNVEPLHIPNCDHGVPKQLTWKTRTKTRAMLATENKCVSKLPEEPNKTKGTILDDFETAGGNNKKVNKTKIAIITRSRSKSPVPNDSKRKKSEEFNNNETFTKSSQMNNNPIDESSIHKPLNSTTILQNTTIANQSIIMPHDQTYILTPLLNKQVNTGKLMINENVANDKSQGAETESLISMKPTMKKKTKVFNGTPIRNNTRALLTISQTTSTVGKSNHKNVLLTQKLASALKAHQHEFLEREPRKKVNEMEFALSKAKRDKCKHYKKEIQLKTLETRKPIYSQMEAPLLPLDDCYDTDDERRPLRILRPNWTRKIKPVLMCILHAGDEVTNTFFMRTSTTPVLNELFEGVNPKKLTRTSSAIWHEPPCFTIMPVLIEEVDDED